MGVATAWCPAGAQLEITGNLLDGSAPPLKVQSLLLCNCFPSDGDGVPDPRLLEVTAKADGKVLRFVTRVVPKARQ